MKRAIARVPNHDGKTHFNVVLVEEGDRYGLNDCLVYDYHDLTFRDGDPLVEFYDERYPHTQYGQFVTRLHASVLEGVTAGLDLLDHVPAWKVDAQAMATVRAALAVLE